MGPSCSARVRPGSPGAAILPCAWAAALRQPTRVLPTATQLATTPRSRCCTLVRTSSSSRRSTVVCACRGANLVCNLRGGPACVWVLCVHICICVKIIHEKSHAALAGKPREKGCEALKGPSPTGSRQTRQFLEDWGWEGRRH